MRRLKIRENKRCIFLFIRLKWIISRSYIHMVDYGKVFRTVVSKGKTSLFLKCVLFHMERLSNPPVWRFLDAIYCICRFSGTDSSQQVGLICPRFGKGSFCLRFPGVTNMFDLRNPFKFEPELASYKTLPHTKTTPLISIWVATANQKDKIPHCIIIPKRKRQVGQQVDPLFRFT